MDVPDEVGQDEALSSSSRDLNKSFSIAFCYQLLNRALLVVTKHIRLLSISSKLIVSSNIF